MYLSCHEPAIIYDDTTSSFEEIWHGEGAKVGGLSGVDSMESRCEEEMFMLDQLLFRSLMKG